MAPELVELVVGDPPEAWEAAGFAVGGDGCVHVGGVRVRLVGPERGKRVLGWTLAGLPAGDHDLHGLPTTGLDGAAAGGPASGAAPAHPNGAVALDHVVVASPDPDRTVAALTALGIERRRTREVPADHYGFPAVQHFFRLGAAVLELVGPAEPDGDGPARFFGLAWTVADLDALAVRLGPALGRIKDAVQPGRRIATLRHEEVGMSVATAFMSP